jgi:hypothetical protein
MATLQDIQARLETRRAEAALALTSGDDLLKWCVSVDHDCDRCNDLCDAIRVTVPCAGKEPAA